MHTKKEFKDAVEERLGRCFSVSQWHHLGQVLEMAAIHEGFSDADVDAAEFIIKELQSVFSKEIK